MDHVFLYQHTMRTEWGYGAVMDSLEDRTTFRFDDGTTRTIKQGHIHLMVRVELDEPEASEVRKRIARPAKAAAAAAAKRSVKAKKTTVKAKAAAAAASE